MSTPLHPPPSPSQGEGREPDQASRAPDRRGFLRMLAGAAVGAFAVRTVQAESGLPSPPPKRRVPQHPTPFVDGNHLERMRSELEESLRKPVEQRRWGMLIDLRKCIGCKACTVSCEAENVLPPGVVYRPVMTEEIGEFPNVRKRFLPRPCMQCDDPPCVPPCPVGATYKRADGVVAVDYDQCIGCRYCVTSCPYGARSFDFGEFHSDGTPEVPEYEQRKNYEYGEVKQRTPEDRNASPMGNARKCHFCLHRVEAGILPACVTTCLGGATYFGDLANPESLVNELRADERVMRLKEELGTHPKVFYLT